MGNKGCLTVLLVGFAAVGVLLAYFWLASVFEAIRTRTWDEAPGEILSNEGQVDQAASDNSEPFVYRMRYRYRYQGQVQESEQSGRAADWSEIAGRLKKYPPGALATVHVNPRQPKHNYLELPSLWVIAFFPLPLAFLAAMLHGLHCVWFGCSAESRPRQPRRLEGRGLVIMFGLFTLVGGGTFIGLVLKPATHVLGSRQWPQTTCTVEFSRVGTHTGGAGAAREPTALTCCSHTTWVDRSTGPPITIWSMLPQETAQASRQWSIGSVRRECLDHLIIVNEASLRRILAWYLDYYHASRTHLSLGKDCPAPRSIQPPDRGRIVAVPQVGGLHHRYERRAASEHHRFSIHPQG